MRITSPAPTAGDAALLEAFHAYLVKRDLAPATVRVYLHDLTVFQNWLAWIYETPAVSLIQVGTADLATFRKHLLQEKSHRATTINRRLQTLRLFYRWLQQRSDTAENPAEHLHYLREARREQPAALKRGEVLVLLRAADASPHGQAKRNVALVQLLLQTGLRVSEAAALKHADLHLGARAGSVAVRAGKGLKFRRLPLNATARRALQNYMETLSESAPQMPLFLSKRQTPLSVRAIQNVIAELARRAGITRIAVSAHTLRHSFAVNFLKSNPGKLIELADLLGHESLDTTAIYARPSHDDLALDVERSPLNVLGE
jgi:site-specific recombinase XerD